MKKKDPIEMNSMQKGLQSLAMPKQMFAPGGTVGDPLMDQSLMTPGGAIPAAAPQMPDADPTADPLINQGFQTPSGMTDDGGASQPAMPSESSSPDLHSAITAAISNLQNTPDTNPNIYQGMTAEDRLALQKQLMAKMNSGGNLVAQGLGGLGDAISNSYGHKNTSFQNDITANNQKQMENQLGAADTYRSDKLQDIQGNQQAQLSDPNSAMSQSMRKTLQSAGLKVPSGMSGEIMLKIAGPLGELALKQTQVELQRQQINATQGNAEASRREEAAKALGERPWYQKAAELLPGVKSDSTKELQGELGRGAGAANAAVPHGIPDLGSTFNGRKVLSVKKVS